ncbi:hypothetical protein GCM10010349_62990 [Streptomyces flavofungini]|nr:hypothetical protein GCM10010349_62990 [Streptomyces flavofungini]
MPRAAAVSRPHGTADADGATQAHLAVKRITPENCHGFPVRGVSMGGRREEQGVMRKCRRVGVVGVDHG